MAEMFFVGNSQLIMKILIFITIVYYPLINSFSQFRCSLRVHTNEEYVLFCMSSKLRQEQKFPDLVRVFIMLAFINVPLCRKMVAEFHRHFPQIQDKILSSVTR